jgi:hypothetical protein
VALKPDDALEAARNIWAGPRIFEAQRLNYIAVCGEPPPRLLGVPEPAVEPDPAGLSDGGDAEDAPQVMKNLAWKSRTNFLPLILDTFSQVIKADGYTDTAGDLSHAWQYWQANGMDARQGGIHRAAMQYGASYATACRATRGR